MPLLNTHQHIPSHYLLPDQIEVNFQICPRWSLIELRKVAYQEAFTVIGLNKWRHHLEIGERTYPVVFQFIPAGRLINCYVTLNVLNELHNLSLQVSPEIPNPRSSRNWLAPFYMRSDNRHVWDQVDARLTSLRAALSGFIADGCRHLGGQAPDDLIRSLTVTSVEVCCDIRCLNPRFYVGSLRSSFAVYLGEVEERPYGLTPPYTERYGAGHMISASRATTDRIKAYAKTSRRVRLEHRLDSAALRSVKIGRRINTRRTFRQFFELCATHCAWYFNMLLQDRRLVMNINSQETPFDLLACFAGTVRHTHKLRELLDILVCEGSVANNFDRQLIDRLKRMEPAVLVASCKRGYSTLAPQFRRAAWQLSRCQQSFSVASPRRRQRTSHVIRGAKSRGS